MDYKSQIKKLTLSGNIDLAIQVAASVSFNINRLFREILDSISTPIIYLGGGRSLRAKVENWLDCRILSCSSKSLTTLDVSSNTALTVLDCYNNELTTLDLSSNKALTILWCNSNQLATLDVSNSTALTDLYCSSNQLTKLDLSSNTTLTSLYCSYNQLTTLQLASNSKLTFINCRGNNFSALEKGRIQAAVPNCKIAW